MRQLMKILKSVLRKHQKIISSLLVFFMASFAFGLTSCEKKAAVSGRTAEDRIMNAWNPTTNTNTYTGSTYSSGLYYFTSDDGTEAAVSKGDCTDTSVVIPSAYGTIPVVGIKEEGFINSTTLISVTLPSTITMIGSAAFKNTGLESIAMPYSMVTINPLAFMNCTSLTSVTFAAGSSGNQITTIGEYAFAGCGKLAIFDFPSKCGIIGEAAFQGDYSLLYLILPKKCPDPSDSTKTIISVAKYAFADCSNLNYVFFGAATTITVADYAFKNCKQGAVGEFEGDLPTALSSSTNWKYLFTSSTPTIYYLTINVDVGAVFYNSGFFFHVDSNGYDGKPSSYGDDVYIMRYNGSASTDTAGSVALSIPPIYKDSDGILHRIVGVTNNVFASHSELGSLTFTNVFDTDGDGVNEDVANNIRYLGNYAFAKTFNLGTIDLLNAVNLISIGDGCFGNTELKEYNSGTNTKCTSLVFPHTLQTIGAYAFVSWTALASIRFDGTNATDPTQDIASLTTIGKYAFKFANQNGAAGSCEIVFPKTLTAFSPDGDSSAFSWCHWIKSIVFTEPTDTSTKLRLGKWVFSRDYFINSITLSSNISYFGEQSFEFLSGDSNNNAKYGQHNSGLDWPISSIHSLFVPSGVSTSGYLFQHTVRLTFYSDASSGSFNGSFDNIIENFDKTIYNTNPYNGSGFSGPTYYNVYKTTIETDGGGTITNGATMSTSLRNRIHYTNASYGDFDFVQTEANSTDLILTRFNYNGADESSSAASTTTTPKIPASFVLGDTTYNVTSIGDSAFFNSYYRACSYTSNAEGGITKVTIPNTVTSIGSRAFARCNLLAEVDSYTGDTVTANTLPTSLTSLGAFAFGWDNLSTITIPGPVSLYGTSTAGNPFVANTGLSTIAITNAGTYNSDGYIIYKKSGTNSYYYLNSVVLSHTDTALTLNNNVNVISDVAFRDCTWLTSLTAASGSSLKTIGAQSFMLNTKLASVDLRGATGLTSIGSRAFYGDTSLTSVNASGLASLANIYSEAFSGNTALTTLNLSNCTSLATIDSSAFSGAKKLTGVDLSTCTALKNINWHGFYQSMSDSSLSGTVSVKLPTTAGSTTFLNSDGAFEGCSKMTDLDLGAATKVQNYCFKNCTSLANVNLRNLATVSYQSFEGDSSLTSLSLPSSCVSLTGRSFYNCTGLTNVSWAGDSSTADNAAVTFSSTSADNTTYTWAFARSSSGTALSRIVIPKASTLQPYTFQNQYGLKAANATSATSGIFLKDTGPQFDTNNTAGKYPANWNAVTTDTGDNTRIAKYAVYCPTDSADYESSATDALYWHYVSGVPTVYDPSSF